MKKIIIIALVLVSSITLILTTAFIPKNDLEEKPVNKIESQNFNHPEAGYIEDIG